MSGFTWYQQSALETCSQQLAEHFSGVLIVVMAEPDGGNTSTEATIVYYSGGRIQAIGLAKEAKRSIFSEKSHETDDQKS